MLIENFALPRFATRDGRGDLRLDREFSRTPTRRGDADVVARTAADSGAGCVQGAETAFAIVAVLASPRADQRPRRVDRECRAVDSLLQGVVENLRARQLSRERAGAAWIGAQHSYIRSSPQHAAHAHRPR